LGVEVVVDEVEEVKEVLVALLPQPRVRIAALRLAARRLRG
jgi:hypothetical protein